MHASELEHCDLRDGVSSDAVAQSTAAPAVAAVCAPCHGLDGTGHDVEVPNLAGQHSIYLRKQLLAFKGGRRKHPEMYFVGRNLNDQDIDELVPTRLTTVKSVAFMPKNEIEYDRQYFDQDQNSLPSGVAFGSFASGRPDARSPFTPLATPVLPPRQR